jgi:hypothetical protein
MLLISFDAVKKNIKGASCVPRFLFQMSLIDCGVFRSTQQYFRNTILFALILNILIITIKSLAKPMSERAAKKFILQKLETMI